MIRYLEKNEKQNIRPLYEHCFNDSVEYTDYYFEKRLPNNQVAVNEQDGKIVGAVHLIPQYIIMDKFKTDIIYLYAVGTHETYRKKGVMKELMTKVLRDMYAETQPFTYLIPTGEVNAEIYKKMGFAFVMDKEEIKPVEQRKKPTHSLISRKAENSDLLRMSIFAQSAMEKNYSVSMVKDIDYFRRMKELIDVEGGHIEIYVENKVIVGYRIWVDDEMVEEVLDPTIQTMSWKDGEKTPYAMARIINIRTTLRMLGFKNSVHSIVKITDPVIEENNGCFKVYTKHGSVKVDKTDEKDLKDKIDFELTIEELTAHIFGYKIIEGLPPVCLEESFFINDYV